MKVDGLVFHAYDVLTFVKDWVWDDWLEGESESAFLVALEEDLEAQPDGVQVQGLSILAMRKPS